MNDQILAWRTFQGDDYRRVRQLGVSSVVTALYDVAADQVWNERPGYYWITRAMGLSYLRGIWQAIAAQMGALRRSAAKGRLLVAPPSGSYRPAEAGTTKASLGDTRPRCPALRGRNSPDSPTRIKWRPAARVLGLNLT